MIENVNESHEKVQLKDECNETQKIETPLMPASDLDASDEFAKALNHAINRTNEKDELFTSTVFELRGNSVDNIKTEPIVSQIETVKSFIANAVESNDSFLVSEEQDGSCESDEMVDSGLVPKTEGEIITEAFNQTEIVLAQNAGDINQDEDKENVPILSTDADNDIAIDTGEYNIQNANKMHKISFFNYFFFLFVKI